MESLSKGPAEKPLFVAISILAHVIYGIVTAWTYVKLAKINISKAGNI
jgi:hypothetical protein